MNEETLHKTVRNSLMIAGHEMGPVGDHWPAINAIIKGVDREFEQTSRDAAVVGELEFHIADMLHKLEGLAAEANEHDRRIIMQFADEIWSRYYAIMEPMDGKFAPEADDLVIDGVNEFKNMKAAVHIIKGLGGRA